MKKIAIIGGGIAGLSAAYHLQQQFGGQVSLTVLEKNDYIGGHTCTIDVVDPDGVPLAIDTGFMVFNKRTYPQFTPFLDQLGIAYQPADMSFSLQHRALNLEWNGAGFNKIFAQRRNLFNLRFWRMLLQLDRFNREAKQAAERGELETSMGELSLGDYIAQRGYSEDFKTLFLMPMGSAIWSATFAQMQAFPARTLMRFFDNHGFLGLHEHHQWYTVIGGARQYVRALQGQGSIQFNTGCTMQKVVRQGHQVQLEFASGERQTFDAVILATHADDALALLDAPTALEQALLSAFAYQPNEAILHTDASVMPQRKRCWAAWNYRLDADASASASASASGGAYKTSTHYWVSHLQSLKTRTPHFVSIEGGHLIAPEKRLKTLAFKHPVFSVQAAKAQTELATLNAQEHAASQDGDMRQRVFFCGSYFKYGFHEDAFTAGKQAAAALAQAWEP
ncbi:MAG: FAD-dependent oxidoreductase [Vampirovibrionales bacterium]|nr:FAD-dependent oxidoreductase [Vampirovibrionales bacterium]